MLTRFRRLPSPATVIAFVALLAAVGTGSAVALSGSNNVAADDIKSNAVGPTEIRSNSIHRSEMFDNAVSSSEVANNSLTGDDIDEASLNIQGGGGGGGGGSNLTQFNATLSAGQTKTETIGNFTITAINNAGTCGNITVQSGALDSQRSIGLNAIFANLAANQTATIASTNVSQAFTAVTDDGSSFVSGVVGRAQQGGNCLITGYVTGT